MTTTVHLPPDLLERIDERARGLRLSRSQYVKRALERMLREETEWSRPFVEALEEAADDLESHEAVDEMLRVPARRSRKKPPRL